MSTRDLVEAVELATAFSELLLVRGGPTGQSASVLKRTVTSFQINLESAFRKEAVGALILGLFSDALAAGVSAATFRSVRATAKGTVTLTALADWTQIAFRRQALIAETRRIARTQFSSRNAVDTARAQLTVAFDEIIEDASERLEHQVMRDFGSLFSAIHYHLAATARPLPRIIGYSTASPLPSLVLAHRLYADASRREELELENGAVHPLFMPTSGRALAG